MVTRVTRRGWGRDEAAATDGRRRRRWADGWADRGRNGWGIGRRDGQEEATDAWEQGQGAEGTGLEEEAGG